MSYEVSLDVYEGPFDLLLQLIARRKLDITEIDLGEITTDFLAHLDDGLEALDLETATRFLVVAATLIELKAARLLPREDREELEDLLGEARDVLYARLLEYRAYRDVARILEHRLGMHEAVLPRQAPPEAWVQRLVPDTRLSIDARGLGALAAAVLEPAPPGPVDISHIRRSYLTIRQAAAEVLAAAEGSTTFAEVAADRERGDRVVLFLACLELFKLGHVGLEQPDRRVSFTVTRRTTEADVDAVLDDLDGVDDLEGGRGADNDPDDDPAADAAAVPTGVHGGGR